MANLPSPVAWRVTIDPEHRSEGPARSITTDEGSAGFWRIKGEKVEPAFTVNAMKSIIPPRMEEPDEPAPGDKFDEKDYLRKVAEAKSHNRIRRKILNALKAMDLM